MGRLIVARVARVTRLGDVEEVVAVRGRIRGQLVEQRIDQP
jgi:hypothetical protein